MLQEIEYYKGEIILITKMNDLLFGANIEKDGMFVKDNKTKIGFFANS